MRSASRKIEDGRKREKTARAASRSAEAENPVAFNAADWKMVLDAIPEGMTIHSTDGHILHANKRVAEIYGYNAEELIGRTCDEVFHSTGLACSHSTVVTTRESVSVASAVELGGRVFNINLSPIVDERGAARGYVRTMRDITDRHKAQEHLIRAERFATLGQMISGIAHDVGTPLNIISGYSEYLLMRTRPDAVGHKELTTILQQTRRIADFIKQMLDLARVPQGRADAIGLRDFLGESIDLIGHHMRKSGIKASINCKIAPPLIYGDAPKLRQAFFNLLLNACQAVGAGGSLEIALDRSPADSEDVMLEITGIDAEGKGHDFSKSFSGFLQPGSEVMGMGLTLTKEIFDGYGAKVSSSDKDEQGTALVLYLPKTLEN